MFSERAQWGAEALGSCSIGGDADIVLSGDGHAQKISLLIRGKVLTMI